jgi:hypothetical protein
MIPRPLFEVLQGGQGAVGFAEFEPFLGASDASDVICEQVGFELPQTAQEAAMSEGLVGQIHFPKRIPAEKQGTKWGEGPPGAKTASEELRVQSAEFKMQPEGSPAHSPAKPREESP